MLSDSLQGLRGTPELSSNGWSPVRGDRSALTSKKLPGRPHSPVLGVLDAGYCSLTKAVCVGSSNVALTPLTSNFRPFTVTTPAPAIPPAPTSAFLPPNSNQVSGSSRLLYSSTPVVPASSARPVPSDPRLKGRSNRRVVTPFARQANKLPSTGTFSKPDSEPAPDTVLLATLHEELEYCFEAVRTLSNKQIYQLKVALFKAVQKHLHQFSKGIIKIAESLEAKPFTPPLASRKRKYSDSFGSDPLSPTAPSVSPAINLVVKAATSLESSHSKKAALDSFLAEDIPAAHTPDLLPEDDIFGDLELDQAIVNSK